MTAVIGLDLSLTSTGICDADGNPSTVAGKAEEGDARLEVIVSRVELTLMGGGDLAVIEDLPRGAMGAASTGMVHGAVRFHLMQTTTPYALIVPSVLKKYATGKGTASKIEMALSAWKRAEMEFVNDDECDAWWLRCMGLDHLGEPLFELPAVNRAALEKVTWP